MEKELERGIRRHLLDIGMSVKKRRKIASQGKRFVYDHVLDKPTLLGKIKFRRKRTVAGFHKLYFWPVRKDASKSGCYKRKKKSKRGFGAGVFVTSEVPYRVIERDREGEFEAGRHVIFCAANESNKQVLPVHYERAWSHQTGDQTVLDSQMSQTPFTVNQELIEITEKLKSFCQKEE